jgi:hypothetical protein
MIAPLHVSGFDWRYAPVGTEAPKADLSLLAPALRRGLSDPTRLFMHVARGALERAQLPAAQMHVVFASAFGEIVAAEQLMAQAFSENSSSPARFRHSVHHTAAGLFSISTQNRLPATAISAGWDTPAMGLLEAGTLLSHGGAGHVLLVFVEEPVPDALSAEHGYPALAAALVLSPAPTLSPLASPRARFDQARGRIEHLRREPRAPNAPPEAGLNHPLAPCVALCRALEARARVTLVVGEGPEPWCVDVDTRADAHGRRDADAQDPA